jgi:hypothetical protein
VDAAAMGITLLRQSHKESRQVGRLTMPYDALTSTLQISVQFKPMPLALISGTLLKQEPCVAA